MLIVKKLFTALPFLLSFAGLLWQLNTFLQNPNLILEFNVQIFTQIGLLFLFLLLTSLFFVTFSTLTNNWKMVVPVIIFTSFCTFVILSTPLNLVMSTGVLASLLLIFFLLEKKLATYLTFQATTLLIPSIKNTLILLVIISSFTFYIAANIEVPKQEFKLPKSIVDLSLQFSMGAINQQGLGNIEESSSQPTIPQDQVQMLKNNPELLKQAGLTPEMLDLVSKPKTSQNSQKQVTQNLLRNTIEEQINNAIKPYTKYLPILLAAFFFLTFESFTMFASIFLFPAVWFIFYFLEVVGFTKYETETRDVKKLVV